jgi:DNA repair protein RecO (recombination protein O)
MHWTDDGIVLGVRKHGEANAILELMTRAHGRHLGLVRGGGGSRLRPVLQPGNTVHATWSARLDDHLGTYAVEGINLRTATLLTSSYAVYAVTHLAALARLLPERDPHEAVFDSLEMILESLDDPALAGAHVVHFEMQMLTELGFGLDLMSCAATGQTHDLAYVSPKSGRAVSRDAGRDWSHRLFALPAFLTHEHHGAPSAADLNEGFRLTGFFLSRDVLEPRNLTFADARAHFIAAIARALPNAA